MKCEYPIHARVDKSAGSGGVYVRDVQSAQRRKSGEAAEALLTKKNTSWRCDSDPIRVAREKVELPKSPAPVRPFRIRYMAQDRGPEVENAPGFMPSKIPGEACRQRPVGKQ